MGIKNNNGGGFATSRIIGWLAFSLGISVSPGLTADPGRLAEPQFGISTPRPGAVLQQLLQGYNYVLKTGTDGRVESLFVSGMNGSGAGNHVAESLSDTGAATHSEDAERKSHPPLHLQENLQGQAAVDALANRLPAIAAGHGMTPERLREILLNDATAWIDIHGRLYYVESPLPDIPPEQTDPPSSDGKAAAAAAPLDLGKTFLLHSRPGASKIIYLDFNGHTVTGTAWNNAFSIPAINAPAFDTGGNAAVFDDDELARIQNIWSRVAEDYAPFDVDVTTEEPAADALERSSASDQAFGTRAVVTTRMLPCRCGGIAYVGTFDYPGSYYKPAWIFYDMLGGGNEKYVAETISHEVGHNLGLNHDGNVGTSYYQGHGRGTAGWAPIMGAGYYKELVQWSKGEYPGANNQEDDIDILQSHGASLRADDAGDTPGSAAPLAGSAAGGEFSVNQSGTIERHSDSDYYAFSTAGGSTNLDIAPAAAGPNLDISAALYDAAGTRVAASNPPDRLNASISVDLIPGTYYLQVDGAGRAASGSDSGYSDYGSLGQYRITGRFAQGLRQAPAALATASATAGTAPLEVGFSGSGSRDDGAIVGYRWDFGDGGSSTEPNPRHTFTTAGAFTIKLTVTNDAGLTDTSFVPVTVNSPGDPTALRVRSMSIVLNGKPQRMRAKVQVQVTDGTGQIVPKVVIAGKWSGLANGKTRTVTDGSGAASLISPAKAKRKGTFTFSVTGLSRGGYTYDPAKNTSSAISITR